MAIHTTQSRDPTIRALSRGIADADDGRIMRIVATVDAMAARGAADDLVASVRHRLVEIRPARPLRLSRLLFLPLDPLIVEPVHWKPNDHTIPRTVIAPMSDVVEAGLGDKAGVIRRALANRTSAQIDLISGLGRMLWPEAAAILATSTAPETWSQTGLGSHAYPDLASKVAALLSQAAALDSLFIETAQGMMTPDRAAIETMVKEVSARHLAALPMLARLLVTLLPTATRLLYEMASGRKAAAIKMATDQAGTVLLAQLEATDRTESLVAAPTLAQSGAAAARVAALLNELDQDGAPQVRRNQVRSLRQRLDADCKARFAEGLKQELLAPLLALSIQPSAAEITELEATARGLRVLESEARGISGGSTYDKLLLLAADQVRTSLGSSGLGLTDKARLVEILAGSDAAMAMLSS